MTDKAVTLRINANAKGVETGVDEAKAKLDSLGTAGETGGKRAAAGLNQAEKASKSLGGEVGDTQKRAKTAISETTAAAAKQATSLKSTGESAEAASLRIKQMVRSSIQQSAASKAVAESERSVAERQGLRVEATVAQRQATMAQVKAQEAQMVSTVGMLRGEALDTAATEANTVAKVENAAATKLNSRATAEIGILFGELASGNYSRMKRSTAALANQTGLLAKLMSPLGLSIIGVSAIVGTFVAALVKGAAEQKKYQRALESTGYAAGVTVGQIDKMRDAVAGSDADYGKASAALAELAASGEFVGKGLRAAAQAAVSLANATGHDIGDATQEIEALGKDPVDAITKLNEHYHFLTLSQYDHIAALQAEGRTQAATTAAAQAAATAFKARADEIIEKSGALSHAAHAVGKGFASMWQNIKDLGRDDDQYKLNRALSQYESLQERISNAQLHNRKTSALKAEAEATQVTIDKLRAKAAAEDAVAAAKAESQRIIDAGIAAQKRVNELLQEAADKTDGVSIAQRRLITSFAVVAKAQWEELEQGQISIAAWAAAGKKSAAELQAALKALQTTSSHTVSAGQQLVNNLQKQVAMFGLSAIAAKQYEIAHTRMTASQRAAAQAALAALEAKQQAAAATKAVSDGEQAHTQVMQTAYDKLQQLHDQLDGMTPAQIAYGAAIRAASDRMLDYIAKTGDATTALARFHQEQAAAAQVRDATPAPKASTETSTADIIASLQAMKQYKMATAGMSNIQKGIARTVAKATAAWNALSDKQKAAGVSLKAVKDAARDAAESAAVSDIMSNALQPTGIDAITEKIDLVQKKIKKTGEELADAFGTDKAKSLTEEMKKLDARLGVLNNERLGAMAGLASNALRGIQSLTKEGSKEYEALNIAASALAGVQGISAIINQGTSGDPYSAFGRIAAMTAVIAPLLASIGQSVSSAAGSGFTDTAAKRQASQGTGSVLGDATAKSESIVNATKITADATKQLVGINRGMLTALQAMQAGIGSASTMLARGAGDMTFDQKALSVGGQNGLATFFSGGLGGPLKDPLHIFSGKSKITDQGIKIMGGTLKDMIENVAVGAYQEVQSKSWAFGSTHTKEGVKALTGAFAKQFQLILQSIADTVREGAKALGIDAAQIDAAIAAYKIAEQKISLKGLSAEDQQKALEAVFSKIFDGLAGAVVPFIDQFQKVGEGLGETLVRVATEVQVTQVAMKQLGLSIATTDPEKFAQIADGLVTMAGGVDDFIGQMQSFVDKFAPDSAKLEQATAALNSAFDQANLTLPDTRDGMYALMQSLDATTEAGREQITTLLRLSDTADKYYTMIEKKQDDLVKAQYDQASLVASLQAEMGTNPLASKLLEISKWSIDTSNKLNELAKAQGLAGASAKDLALVQEVAAARGAAAIRALESASADLAAQLGYTSTDGATGALNNFGSAVGKFAQDAKDGIDLLIGDLSPYTDRQRLELAKQGQRAGTVTPDQVLQIAQRVMGSGADYTQLFNEVMAVGDRTQGARDSANFASTANATASIAKDTLTKAERYQLADQLANNIADLAFAQAIGFADVADKLGFNLDDLAKDLGLSDAQLNNYLNVLADDNFGLSDLNGILANQVDRLIAAITGQPSADGRIASGQTGTIIPGGPPGDMGHVPGVTVFSTQDPYLGDKGSPAKADPELITLTRENSDRLDAQAKMLATLLAEIRDASRETADATGESARIDRDKANDPGQQDRRPAQVPSL